MRGFKSESVGWENPADLSKIGGEKIMKKLTALFCYVWVSRALLRLKECSFLPRNKKKIIMRWHKNYVAHNVKTIILPIRMRRLQSICGIKSWIVTRRQIETRCCQFYGWTLWAFCDLWSPLTVATVSLWVIPALFVILGFRLLFRRHTKQVVTAQASEPRLSDEQKQRLQRLLQEKKEWVFG